MALKLRIDSTVYDGLPDVLKGEYKKDGDGYALDAPEAFEYKIKADEFRGNNKKMFDELEASRKALERFKDVDPVKYAEAVKALDQLEKMEEGDLLKKGDLDAVINKRTASMKKDFDAQLAALQKATKDLETERDAVRTRLGITLIDTDVQNVINKVGKVRAGALGDIIRRARGTWKLDNNGDAIPRDEAGQIIFGKDGKQLTKEEWAANLLNEAPFLFEGGGGGGGGGAPPSVNAEGKKTIRRDDPNYSKSLPAIAKGELVVID